MDLIIGGGKYGCKAIEYLRPKHKKFIVLDSDPNCLAVKKFKLRTLADADSINNEQFIFGGLPKALELLDRLKPEYVFPTAPVHIAAGMAEIKFNLSPWNEAINCILPKLPQAVVLHTGKGTITLSFNPDKVCLENCTMPKVCPSSGTQKPCTMTQLMRYASPEAFILVSHSMAPGIGALKGDELLAFLEWAELRDMFIVGTSCDCHGVFSAFQRCR